MLSGLLTCLRIRSTVIDLGYSRKIDIQLLTIVLVPKLDAEEVRVSARHRVLLASRFLTYKRWSGAVPDSAS